MASVLHRCPYCAYETDLSNSLPMLAENPHCRQCGLSVSESEGKMTNDLAALFARQMNVGGVPQAATPHADTPPTPDVSSPISPSAPPIVYSTQHYHHSGHQVATSAHPPGMPSVQERSDVSPEEMLRSHDVDPFSLFPSQLSLFKEASTEQKARLMELWRISPPRQSSQLSHMASGSNEMGDISMESAQRLGVDQSTTQDDEMMDTDTHHAYAHAEPYVVSGYEQAPSTTQYVHSTDPVYKGHDFWEQPPNGQQQKLEMEDQYGAFESQRMFFGCGVRRAHWLGENESLC